MRDNSQKQKSNGEPENNIIPSKSFLKNRVLVPMEAQGFITRARADDVPQYRHSGWKLNPNKAFKRTDPAILATLKPMPQLEREDYKEYLREMNIPYEFWVIY